MAPLIRVLPEEIANRIAAGEVVERPASVVKELVENALDADARHIEIELEGGGTRLVRVRDDGHGMAAEDLALCVQSHATSKIAAVEDLFRVASFGFRGEALPSIASVSELTMLSRQAQDEVGARLRSRGGDVEGPTPAGGPVGTTVEVRNLFFNVPARRKFLKAERTELGHALEAVTRLLLPEPEVGARIIHNGKKVLEVAPDDDLRGRIGALFGRRVAEPLLECDTRSGDLRLRALFGPPSQVRGNSRHQYLFLNGRYIKDRSLGFALKEAYRGLIMPKDHPVAFLFIDMNPAEVDVNVHPTKTEVRFRDRDRLFGLVRGGLRSRLSESGEDRPLRMSAPSVSPSVARADMLQTLEQELFSGAEASAEAEGGAAAVRPAPADRAAAAAVPSASSSPPAAAFTARAEGAAEDTVNNPCRSHGRVRPVPVAEADAGQSGRFLQIHRSYIVVESPEGLRIVDQHALHERRLYEELLQRLETAEGEDQRLLVPEVVDLGAADQAVLLDRLEDLAALGIELEAFGGNSVCLRSVPMVLSKAGAEQLVLGLVSTLRDEKRRLDRRSLCAEVAANLACRAAVKFNDSLPDEEIAALLAWAAAHPEARNCPHGRPVSVSVDLRELENQFQRKK